jgi:hypothetical protein
MKRKGSAFANAVVMAFVFVLSLCLMSIALGQPVAKITGPERTLPGELTQLKSEGSEGSNLLWITPKDLAVVVTGCDTLSTQVFFATVRTGSYDFLLVVSDETGIAYSRHTVVIGQAEIQPPTPAPELPPTQPTPPPVTPGKWSVLEQISKANADKVADPATRGELKKAITDEVASVKKLCEGGQCPGLEEVKRRVSGAIEQVLLRRDNRFSLWAQTWRLPNSNLLASQPPRDVPDYLAAAVAIAAGL